MNLLIMLKRYVLVAQAFFVKRHFQLGAAPRRATVTEPVDELPIWGSP